jgi:hypothetical protein
MSGGIFVLELYIKWIFDFLLLLDQQDLCPARISGHPPVFGCLGPPEAYDTVQVILHG